MCPCENVEGAHDFVGGYFCVSKRYSLISDHLYMVYYVFNIIDVHVYYNCYECLCVWQYVKYVMCVLGRGQSMFLEFVPHFDMSALVNEI